jgi:uncharacterized protein YbjQ (UPF0145 family)
MIEWWQLLTIGGFVVIFVGLVLVGVQLRRLNGISKPSKKGPGQSFNEQALEESGGLFNKEFHEELRNRGRLHFDEEFAAYEKAMKEAQELAINSLQKSATAVEEQRLLMVETLKKDVADKEALLIKTYEENMAKIVEHYILETLGDQFDLKTQLPFIISQMEANKQKIVDDMRL